MTPIDFPGRNVLIAEDQPEYQTLPAMALHNEQAEVISCWELTDEEISAIVKNKCFYISQWRGWRVVDGHYIPNSLQPLLPMAELGDNLYLNLPPEQ